MFLLNFILHGLLFLSLLSVSHLASASCTNLTGSYTCSVSCPAEVGGKLDYVAQQGNSLTLTNGTGQQGIGTLDQSNNITLTSPPNWTNLSAKVSSDCKTITYSNSSVWTKNTDTTPTCTAPQVLQNGVCVTPTNQLPLAAFSAMANYSEATNLLTLPDVQVAGQHVYVELQHQGNYLFSIHQVQLLANATVTQPALYDLDTGLLTIPSVNYANNNYRVTLSNVGNYLFKLNDVTPIDHPVTTTTDDSDELSPEELTFLDGLIPQTIDPSSITLPSGMTLTEFGAKKRAKSLTPKEQLDKYLWDMIMTGIAYADRSRHQIVLNEGGAGPAQNGIAYAFGAKDASKRQVPPDTGRPKKCTTAVFGIDCSGLITQMANVAGMKFSIVNTNAAALSLPNTWKAAKADPYGPIQYYNVPSGSYKIGDIVVFASKATGRLIHVGMVVTNDSSNPVVLQSAGSSGDISVDEGSKGRIAECEANLGPTRGPTFLTLSAMMEKGVFASTVIIVRPSVGMTINFVGAGTITYAGALSKNTYCDASKSPCAESFDPTVKQVNLGAFNPDGTPAAQATWSGAPNCTTPMAVCTVDLDPTKTPPDITVNMGVCSGNRREPVITGGDIGKTGPGGGVIFAPGLEAQRKDANVVIPGQRTYTYNGSTYNSDNSYKDGYGQVVYNWDTAKEVATSYGAGWHLPTKEELNLLCQQQSVVGGFFGVYWSSTEYSADYAWVQGFSFGNQGYYHKYSGYSSLVRAVRAF